MAEALWMRSESEQGNVLLEVYWDDVSEQMLRIFYRNLTTQEALLQVYSAANVSLLDEYLPTGIEKTVTPNPNKRPSLTGVTAYFTWPSNPRVSGRR